MKKVFLYIVIALSLLAIPATVFLVGQQQDVRSQAAPATTISFNPATSTKNIGETFKLNIDIDPAKNQVTTAKLFVSYDPLKLEAIAFTNGTLAPTVLNSGVVGAGTASITVGAASNSQPITKKGTIAVLTFKTKDGTGTTPTSIQFTPNTFVGAIKEPTANVLIGSVPAKITISGESTTGAAPTPGTGPVIISFGGTLGNVYSPKVATVSAGSTVQWTGDFTKDPMNSNEKLWRKRKDGTTFSYTFIKPGTYGFYSTKNGTKKGTGMAGSITVTGTASGPENASVGAWDFNENTGTSITDGGEQGNNGTWHGTGTHWDPAGIDGSAALFNGTDDYIEVASSASISLEYTSPFSIMGWFKTSETSDKPQIAVEKMSNDAKLRGYSMAFVAGKILVTLQNDASINPANAIIVQTSTTTVNDGKWHYVGFTYDGSGKAAGVKIYKDGVLVTDRTVVADTLTKTIVNSSPLLFGKRAFDPDKKTIFYKGSMDDVQIYNYARTLEQIRTDSENGAPTTPTTTLTPTPTQAATTSAIQILTPVNNVSITTGTPTIQGKAPAGSTITLTIYSEPQTAVVTADASGNWSYVPTVALAPGPHSIVASIQSGSTTETATVAFVVASDGASSEEALPVSGTFETTMLIIAIGFIFLTTGTILALSK